MQRTAVSAGAIIVRASEGELKIALAHHPRSEKAWVVPKGHVEPGETIEQAALREIYEETGLSKIRLLNHLGSLLRESMKSNGDVVQKTIHYYLAYALDENPTPVPTDTAFIAIGWFSPQEALRLLPYEEERALFSEQLAPLLACL